MQILICDDDKMYAEGCKRRLMKLAKQHKINATIELVESGKQLLFFLDTKYQKADLIYLDNHMPELSGMETALSLRNKNIMADIVFYTADDSYAIDAYDVEALHYIVKGQTDDRKFESIFLKAVKRYKNRNTEMISFSCAGEHRNIIIGDILYFEVQNRIVTVHYTDENKVKTFEFYSSLSKIEEFLFGNGFIRIHSSYLVAEKYIRKRTLQQVTIITEEVLPVGKSYRKALK